jgi:hypothetical protein
MPTDGLGALKTLYAYANKAVSFANFVLFNIGVGTGIVPLQVTGLILLFSSIVMDVIGKYMGIPIVFTYIGFVAYFIGSLMSWGLNFSFPGSLAIHYCFACYLGGVIVLVNRQEPFLAYWLSYFSVNIFWFWNPVYFYVSLGLHLALLGFFVFLCIRNRKNPEWTGTVLLVWSTLIQLVLSCLIGWVFQIWLNPGRYWFQLCEILIPVVALLSVIIYQIVKIYLV